ncbi:DNA ligase D [Allobacillus halotolerans]|uniref:DNA ligase (ATP) n=1 Tax=Allobacillus halotolerans TaxID=570278 RepID=A0ABS6GSR0_9BACI|nr:DNA ligase D [Allobacillus halotolerans]MBU6081533.1 DNA ligase D [Allobacillus halotolerans]
MWKPMLTTYSEDAPIGDQWRYEVKYDGFRCGLEWKASRVTLWSRNGKELNDQFPEIIKACEENQDAFENALPLLLDCELVIPVTNLRTNFSELQTRGRMKSTEAIAKKAAERPAKLYVFDLLKHTGKSLKKKTYQDRRNQLEKLFKKNPTKRLNLVAQYKDLASIEEDVFLHQAEGILAKKVDSTYQENTRSKQWLKIKNWRQVQGIVTGWNQANDYYDLSVYDKQELVPLGKVKNGFPDDDRQTLNQFIRENGQKLNQSTWQIPEGVCIEVNCLNARNGEIREPLFNQFRFDLVPKECTWDRVQEQLAQLPEDIDYSNLDKQLFSKARKVDLLIHLRKVAPLMLPHLYNKKLTVIRFPDGIYEESFYQKHVPEYAPGYFQGNEHLVCNDLKSLIWLGNHAALEFHVPFNRLDEKNPREMVFDIDPPNQSKFPVAVKAAQLIKELCDYKELVSIAKTSGRKGLQIHIPTDGAWTYDETREFMETVAKVLVQKYPDLFTIERMKKNRGERVYIDFLQHAEGKTIIAPYSPRGQGNATVATPLFWEEVNEDLDPNDYTVFNVAERLRKKGCPFQYGQQ